MTRQRSPKIRVLTAVAFVLAALTFLVAPTTLAQQTSAAQQSVTYPPALVPQDASASTSGSISFLPAVAYPSGGYGAHSVEVADVNGDGFPDLVVANGEGITNTFDGSVGVLLGNGDGTFQTPVNYSSGGQGAVSIATADVNGDGHLDLVVANSCQGSDCSNDGSVGVLLGNGDGTFQASVNYSSGGPVPTSVRIADVNGDGYPDLVLANFCAKMPCPGYHSSDSTVSVLLGNGDGTFQAPVNYSSGGAYAISVIVADVNGDGHFDLVVTNLCLPTDCDTTTTYKGTVGVLLGNGDGSFRAAVNYNSNSIPTSVAIGDVNGDGQPDLVVGGCPDSHSCWHGIVSVLLGKGDGTFGAAVTYDSGAYQVISVAIGDLNGDSRPDLALADECQAYNNCIPGKLSVLLGNGDGTFQGAITYSSGGIDSLSVAIADLNADGRPDLAVANDNGLTSIAGNIGVLLNNGGGQSATTTTVASSLNPSVVGQAVMFTATVSSTAGAPPNGEPITFKNGSSVLGTAPLSGGIASLTTSSLAAGIYTITASYAGDANFSASNSPGLRQVVNSATKSATTTTLASSLNPSIYGQSITWTAIVTTSGSVPPSGKLTFTWGRNIGTATLNSSGVATLTRSNLNADPYPLTAVYAGDASNLGSTSALLNQVVTETTSAVTLTSSPNPSTPGQAVTFTATITSPTVKPTGPVTFAAGKTVLGTAQLSGGKAKFTTSTLAAGSTKVTATYYGDSNIARSSASVTQTVQ